MFDQLNEAIQQMIDTALSGIHTAMPGKIVSYNAATNRAVVKPDLPKAITSEEPLESPQIVEVPVVWPASNGGKSVFTMPLKPGDGVLLSFQQRSIENWLDGKMVMPDDPRQFDLSDCVAIAGCAPGGIVGHSDNVVLKFNDTQVYITPNNTVVMGNPSGNTTIEHNGNTTVKGPVVNIGAGGTRAFGNVNIINSNLNQTIPPSSPSHVPNKAYVDALFHGGGGGGGANLPEAPTDGKAYGRQNATWAQVIAADGDVVDGGNF